MFSDFLFMLCFLPVIIYMGWILYRLYLVHGEYNDEDYPHGIMDFKTIRLKKIKRVISKDDPYGEENWED